MFNGSDSTIIEEYILTAVKQPCVYMILILFSFIYGTISLFALIGNSAIIFITIKSIKKKEKVRNHFISNLAFSNIIIAIFVTPFQVNHFYFFGIFSYMA